MTKQAVENKRLRGRYDIVTRQLQDEYSAKNGWAIKVVNLIANQLDAVVERVGVVEPTIAKLSTTVEDVKEVEKHVEQVVTTETAPKTTKRTPKPKGE